jgi:hypothetical protein
MDRNVFVYTLENNSINFVKQLVYIFIFLQFANLVFSVDY